MSEPSAFEKLIRIEEGFYDKGMTYSKAILGLGYVGMLTIFAGTKQYLGPKQLPAFAMLVSISLFAYVLFELGQMLFITWNAFSLKTVILNNAQNPQLGLQKYVALINGRQRGLLIYWGIMFGLSLPTGLGAASILIWVFIHRALYGS